MKKIKERIIEKFVNYGKRHRKWAIRVDEQHGYAVKLDFSLEQHVLAYSFRQPGAGLYGDRDIGDNKISAYKGNGPGRVYSYCKIRCL